MTSDGPVKRVGDILHQWEEVHSDSTYDPLPTLTVLCEILEDEANKYLESKPDPFDDRHPSRIQPNCVYGNVLKVLYRKESFRSTLFSGYLRENFYSRSGVTDKDVLALNSTACRLILNMLPGFEVEAFNDGTLIRRLFFWATDAKEPLQSYATGLLASAIMSPAFDSTFRELGNKLVLIMLDRLAKLEKAKEDQDSNEPVCSKNCDSKSQENSMSDILVCKNVAFRSDKSENSKLCLLEISDHLQCPWEETEPFLIGAWPMHPLTIATKQVFILKYLTHLGLHQENMSFFFQKNVLELILSMINPVKAEYSRVSFEALKYLAALLCHKKIALEFIAKNGVQKLLEIRRPSISAIGVSFCFCYLAYCEDSLERLCLLPSEILSAVVKYMIWLLNNFGSESGRCHATIFFAHSFQCQYILEEFDRNKGLYDLYNVMALLKTVIEMETEVEGEDENFPVEQIIRHVCVALKNYVEAHLFLKVQELQSLSKVPKTKIYKSSPEEVLENIKIMLELLPGKDSWEPVNKLYEEGAINLLLCVILFVYDGHFQDNMHTLEVDTVKSILDVLNVCAVLPHVVLQLCEKMKLNGDIDTSGLNVILSSAEGEIVADPKVQIAALNVLVTCVCAPLNATTYKASSSSSKKRSSNEFSTNRKALLEKVWESIRINNGIMVLLSLITVKTPITDADNIRLLACQALVGLTRNETVRQILSVLPLFTSGEFQRLLRDPILQEKRQEHVKFQKYGLILLERVLGKVKPDGSDIDVSLTNIHKASVIAQTKIQYNEKQLLMLIHQHLLSRGMKEAAVTLQKEAEIPEVKNHSTNPFLSPFSCGQTKLRLLTPNTKNEPRRLINSITQSETSSNYVQSDSPCKNGFTPIKIKRAQPCKSNTATPTNKFQRQMTKEWPFSSPLSSESQRLPSSTCVTLDSIITEYLTNQHALCKNPMITCPPFNLFAPHKCPDPRPQNSTPLNFTMRYCRGINSQKLNRRLIYSRFCPVKVFKMNSHDSFFTCCEFFGDKYLLAGTYDGEVKVFNTQTGVDDVTYNCHESHISNLVCNKENTLLLTSTLWRKPLSAMWKVDSVFEQVCKFNKEEVLEFSKLNQDRIIGTIAEVATIYDIETKKKLTTLTPSVSNNYSQNRATFNPTDELVLSDGILWDVNSGKEIHKFDKLNQTISGVFHPNGLEIVANTEIWDLRSFRLLRTVPTLDHCSVIFSPISSVIYAVGLEKENMANSPYDTYFRTYDPHDYSSITTVEINRNINHITCNKYDTNIAIVENLGDCERLDESSVRLYDVGRSINSHEKLEEEKEEASDSSNQSGSVDNEEGGFRIEFIDSGSNGSDDDFEFSSTSNPSDSDQSANDEF